MATKTLDPKTVTNINGDTIPYRQLSNRVNLTSGSGYANWGAVYNTTNSDGAHYGCNPKNTLRNYCKAIAGKNGSHRCPSRIDCTNYQAGLPANAKVTGITVSYRYDKGGYSNNSYPNIGAPTIDLLGVNVAAKKGTSPPKDSAQSSAKNFSLSWTGLNLKGSDVNKTAFGVAFKLPCNTNTEPGYIRMSYLRVTINYVAENYIPTIQSISPENAVYGNKFIATFKIDETNKAVPSDNVSAAITIPSGLSVSRVLSVNGSFNTGNNVWTAKTTNYTATLQIELTTTGNSTGSKNLKITVGNNSAQKTLTVLSIDINLSCSITGNTVEIPSNDNIDNPQILYLHIKVGKNSPVDFYTSINLNINIPPGLKIKDPNIANKIINGVYNIQANGTSNGWINNQHNLTIPLIGVTEGEYDITVSSNSISNSCSFHVIVTMPEPTTGLYYGAFQLPQFSYDQMKDGKTYVFGCYSRYIGNNIVSGAKNLRAVVINGDTVVWSEKTTTNNEWEWLEIRFEYNTMFPVEIQFYGDYLDYGTGEPHFSNFLLMDEDQYRGEGHKRYSSPLLYLKPLENLFEDSIEESMLTFDPPERIQSAEHYLSDFNLEPLKNAENIKIQGLAVSMDINIEDLTGIRVGLGTKDSKEFFFESKSKVPPETNHINFGGQYENWTIPFKDLPDFLNNVELFLQLDADAEKLEYQYDVRVSNVSLVIYYSEDISNGCGFSIDEIHGKYYNIKWLNNKMPEGGK